MTSKITLFVFALLLSGFCFAQTPNSEVGGGEFIFNADKTPCLTSEQRSGIVETIQTNIEELRLQNRLSFSETQRGGHPLFVWPVQKSTTSTYNEVWGISNYVDHNQNAPDQLTDYNCGTRTYDTSSGYNHQGLDVFSWPFGWYMMDNDQAEIVAAAPGQIIVKSDGNFDRSCDFNTTTPWNAVYIQHNDGSIAWYGHLKNGSLTTKNVGDMVSEGEFLGVMGSSGVSTGPHLHFEVYTDNTSSQLVDPYSGTCNSLNADSWWADQKPYNNPGINAALTHSADPVFNTCPTTETTNESNQFDVNQEVFFIVFLKGLVAGTTVGLRIIKPDNTDLFNWTYDLTFNSSANWLRWNALPDVAGEWKWEATYGGETVTHTFNVGTLSIDDETLESTSIYPNPFNDVVNISSTNKIKKASVVDMLGKTVLKVSQKSEEGINEINLAQLSKGMYFITLEGEQNQKKTIKLIKK